MTHTLPVAVRARLDWDAERLRARHVDREPYERIPEFFRGANAGRVTSLALRS